MISDELSRAICQRKEPVEGLSHPRSQANEVGSPLGFWIVPSYWLDWKHSDMISDPAMTLVLWKDLLRDPIHINAWEAVNEAWHQIASRLGKDRVDPDDWQLAVAEAYARAKGIWVE